MVLAGKLSLIILTNFESTGSTAAVGTSICEMKAHQFDVLVGNTVQRLSLPGKLIPQMARKG